MIEGHIAQGPELQRASRETIMKFEEQLFSALKDSDLPEERMEKY